MYNHDNIHFFMMSYWFLYWHFLAGHKSTLFWGMPCWIKRLALIFSLQSSDFRFRLYYHYKRHIFFFNFWDFGNTLLEGVCIRLTWPLYNHDMTQVMNMKEVLCMFMTTVIKCHSLSYVMFNAKMTLFDLPLPFPLTLAHNKDISNNVIFIKPPSYSLLVSCRDYKGVMIMKVSCQSYAHSFK